MKVNPSGVLQSCSTHLLFFPSQGSARLQFDSTATLTAQRRGASSLIYILANEVDT
jgi:hypothetical protein